MTKKREKISINQFEMALDKNNVVEEVLSGTDDVIVQIKKTLGMSDMIEFVANVVESCIDSENGEYVPEAYDFAIRVEVLTRYANFTMPSSMDKRYMLIYNTSAFEQVLQHINITQFNDIIKTIDKKIKFMLDVISSSAVNKINEVINKFAEIATVSEQAFGEVDANEIKKIVQGASKLGNLNEETIAKVILDAQASSEDTENNDG